VFRYLVDQGVTWTQFIPCTEREDSGAVTEHSVSGPEYGAFMCEVFDAWYPDHVGTVSVRMFENIAQRATGGPPELCVFSPTCGNAVVLEANGDVYACDHFVYPDYRLGNIMETPLETLFHAEVTRHFADAKADPRPECQACPWLPLCMQGCPRFVGVDGTPHHYLCRAYQRFFSHAHEGFLALRDRWLFSNGMDPRYAPRIPEQPIGRNDPCPCGSGRKYKACCGRGAAR